MHYPQIKENKGFSLPEVLIVVLTVAILATLAIPQLFSTIQLNRIQTASSLVASKLSEARMIAIKRNRSVSFVVDENNSQIWLESNSIVVGSVEQLPRGIKIKISPNSVATTEYITFNSMGTLITAPPTVLPYYEAKSLELPIAVSITGKITPGKIRYY